MRQSILRTGRFAAEPKAAAADSSMTVMAGRLAEIRTHAGREDRHRHGRSGQRVSARLGSPEWGSALPSGEVDHLRGATGRMPDPTTDVG